MYSEDPDRANSLRGTIQAGGAMAIRRGDSGKEERMAEQI